MGFLRPYRRQLWGSLVVRLGGDGDDGADPVADRPRRQRDRGRRQARPAAAGAGDLRRRDPAPGADRGPARWSPARSRWRSNSTCGSCFYAHLQRLELGFFDGQQTGQLMSRATVDLQAIRFFLGYGLIFITQNLLTIVLASAVMFVDQPLAGADRARPGAAHRLHRLPLQPRLPPRPAGGPAADRRADRGGRGERLRDPHRQGLRPRGVPAAPLPAARSPGSSTRASTRPGCRPSSRR